MVNLKTIGYISGGLLAAVGVYSILTYAGIVGHKSQEGNTVKTITLSLGDFGKRTIDKIVLNGKTFYCDNKSWKTYPTITNDISIGCKPVKRIQIDVNHSKLSESNVELQH